MGSDEQVGSEDNGQVLGSHQVDVAVLGDLMQEQAQLGQQGKVVLWDEAQHLLQTVQPIFHDGYVIGNHKHVVALVRAQGNGQLTYIELDE